MRVIISFLGLEDLVCEDPDQVKVLDSSEDGPISEILRSTSSECSYLHLKVYNYNCGYIAPLLLTL